MSRNTTRYTQCTLESAERKTILINALNKALSIFSAHEGDKLDVVLTNGLRPLAKAMNADRIIFYSLEVINGENRLRQTYYWDTAADSLTERSLDFLPNDPVVSSWVEIIMQDVCINKHLGNMDEDEKAFMNLFGVKSVLVVPIFSCGQFFGGVIFQDHVNERDFDEDCMELYRSAAQMCTSAIIRAEMAQRVEENMKTLQYRGKMLEVLLNTAVVFLSRSEAIADDMMTAGVSLVADMVDIDRFGVWRNVSLPDGASGAGLSASQIYHWDRTSGGSTETSPSMRNIAYSQFSPQMEEMFTNGESLNSLVSQLPETSILRMPDAMSVFGTPIFINNALWGFVFFADCRTERHFDDVSVEMMHSAAFMIANTIIHFELGNEIADKNELNRIMFNAAPIGLMMFDDTYNIIECNATILAMFGTTKQTFIDKFSKFSPEYQPDGSLSRDRALKIMERTLCGEKSTLEWEHCTDSGESVPCEITLTRVKYEGKYFGVCYVYDLRNIKNMEQQLEVAVARCYRDPLTGTKNRRYFDEHLNHILKSLPRSSSMLSLLMVDVDNFKKYNDTYGHIEGDHCLKIIAHALVSCVTRVDDFVARYGGEEFAVVLPNTDANGARLIAEKLCEKVRNKNIPHEKNDAANCVTISVGGTTGCTIHTQSANDYIEMADKMLYLSKHEGRNRASLCCLNSEAEEDRK